MTKRFFLSKAFKYVKGHKRFFCYIYKISYNQQKINKLLAK